MTAEAEAEPVVAEVEPEPEPVVAEVEPEPEPVIAESEEQPVTAEADQPAEGETADAPLVGVMDPEASSQPTETPWQAPDSYVPDTEEHAAGQGSSGDEAPVEATADDGSAVGQDAGSGEHVDEGSEEPVPVGEARVVMPRSTGAGSWLRWPNGSSDRSDLGQ